MTSRILVAYATKHGSTWEVAEAIATSLRKQGLAADVQRAHDAANPERYDAVILGGALYMGRWHRDARHFLERHRRLLGAIPVAVFAMGPATTEEKAVASSREQLDRALAGVPEVRPVSVAIFGGVIDPATLRFPLNRMAPSDARDWDAIRAWAGEVAGHLPAYLHVAA
ncbi:MAG: menaquinone-dependent protoporphyrinogen oxidase [Solirubrobacteraceae bacterium]|nr:menaquinone-dependent protoporphyrinogen oxidase [Solirubrobacteraceae bacterium]